MCNRQRVADDCRVRSPGADHPIACARPYTRDLTVENAEAATERSPTEWAYRPMTRLYRVVTLRGMHRRATEVQAADLDTLGRLAKHAMDAKAELERAILDAIHQGYSLRTIAEHADIPHMSVKRRLRRALGC